MALEEAVCREVGTQLAFAEDIVFSSTNLINTYLSLYPKEIAEYLEVFRKRHSLDEVLNTIDGMKALKVLVVGDAIIDEYAYCSAIGKSSKDPVLAMRHLSEDRFAGGALAIANHVADFAGEVTLMSVLGLKNSFRSFIDSSLDPRVRSCFVDVPEWQTVCKRRFLDAIGLNKLFEVYFMDDDDLPSVTVESICGALKKQLKSFDLVLVADFGHGAIPAAAVDLLCEQAPYLVVNTQANAGNRGFHTIGRYRRADYACLAEPEVRLDARNVRGELRPLMESIRNRMDCQYLVATRGRSGCLACARDGEFTAVPSFATNVVDRVGAGDAFLSVTALAAKLGVDLEVLGFLGNVVGAEAVQVIGNAKPISKMSVKKHVTSLLK
jgi:bifunctional ADP-heptose synthase (sugar kinase/adenylyltransferase)